MSPALDFALTENSARTTTETTRTPDASSGTNGSNPVPSSGESNKLFQSHTREFRLPAGAAIMRRGREAAITVEYWIHVFTTIDGFCQQLITAYPIEAPRSRHRRSRGRRSHLSERSSLAARRGHRGFHVGDALAGVAGIGLTIAVPQDGAQHALPFSSGGDVPSPPTPSIPRRQNDRSVQQV